MNTAFAETKVCKRERFGASSFFCRLSIGMGREAPFAPRFIYWHEEMNA